MAIAWNYALRGPADCLFRPRSTNTFTESYFNGDNEVWPRFHKWEAVLDWPVTTAAQYHPLMSHLGQGEGRVFAMCVPMFDYRAALGTKSGAVTFAAAAVRSTSLTVSGTGAFADGDFIQIDEAFGVPRIYKVVGAEVAGVIQIKPGLRVAYAGGGTIYHLGGLPSGHTFLEEAMEITSDIGAAAFPSIDPPHFRGMTVSFETSLKPSP
jgi:hypothetical protein